MSPTRFLCAKVLSQTNTKRPNQQTPIHPLHTPPHHTHYQPQNHPQTNSYRHIHTHILTPINKPATTAHSSSFSSPFSLPQNPTTSYSSSFRSHAYNPLLACLFSYEHLHSLERLIAGCDLAASRLTTRSSWIRRNEGKSGYDTRNLHDPLHCRSLRDLSVIHWKG